MLPKLWDGNEGGNNMQITMPICMIIVFLAASAVAGLALALWWMQRVDIKSMQNEIRQLKEREENK